jgi:RNA polymerase sigma-70 factor (ECF subfamily)
MSPATENEQSEEIRLLGQIGAGDRDAFRDLYARYNAPLHSLAVRLLGDAGAAEEALQDAFVKVWRHAADYDPRKSRPFTWAVTILRRTCIDQIRKRRRSPVATTWPEHETAGSEFSTDETIREVTESNEASARIRTALAAMVSPQREALELALYSTLTQNQIAEQLAQPVGTIKTWIRRGLLELRSKLEEHAP